MSRLWGVEGIGRYDPLMRFVTIVAVTIVITVLVDRSIMRIQGGLGTEYPRVELDSPMVVINHPSAFRYEVWQIGHPHPYEAEICKDWPEPNWPIGSIQCRVVWQVRNGCKSLRPPYYGSVPWRTADGTEILRPELVDGRQRPSETTQEVCTSPASSRRAH